MYVIVLPLKYKNVSDINNNLRFCSRSEFFSHEFMNVCDNIQTLVTHIDWTFYFFFQLRGIKIHLFYLLMLLSGDISLNIGPTHHLSDCDI